MGRIEYIMKKKLLLISESMSGGLRKHIVQLIKNLDQNEFEIFFIHGTNTIDEAFKKEYENLSRIAKIIPCRSFVREININNDLKTLKFVSTAIKEINPDIIHCHSSKAGVIGRLAAKINSVSKVYYTPHAYSFLAPEFHDVKRYIFIFIEKLLSRFFTTKTFNVSEGERKAAIKAHLDKKEKFKVVYNGLPEAFLPNKKEIRNLLDLPFDKIIIGNNARMSEQKNPMFFFEIAKMTLEKDNRFHFVWTGSGPLEKSMKEFARENGILDNVSFLGDRKDSEFMVAAYDIFFISSLYEGLPYAPLEAMRASVPIIATNVVGNREIVSENENGFLLDNRDEFIFLVNKILSDSKFSSNSYELFRKKFSLEEMIRSISYEYVIS